MTTFLTVLALIAVIILIIALVVWPIVVWVQCGFHEWDWRIRTRVLHTVGCVIGLALLITVAINSGLFGSDNSTHCGPGTHYVSESYYNAATKTIITDWMCVA